MRRHLPPPEGVEWPCPRCGYDGYQEYWQDRLGDIWAQCGECWTEFPITISVATRPAGGAS